MIRSAPTKPLLRSLTVSVRSEDAAARMEFTGIGVPFNDPIEVFDWFGRHTEEFDPGSVELDAGGAKVFWRHGEIIGRIVEGRDVAGTGYEVDGKISDTTLGRDAYTMLRDGTIDKLSIGFYPLEWREDEDGHIVYTKVRAVEFSLVPNPAYGNADITNVRSASTTPEGNTMDPETLTRDDLAPLSQQMAELQREFSLNRSAPAPVNPAHALLRFNSIGHLLREIARGDEAAATAYRAFSEGVDGGVVADSAVKDSWLGWFINLGTGNRHTINAFGGPSPLPEQGMNVEFGQLKSNTMKVGKQAAEADKLVTGKIELESKTAPIGTFGGAGELSFQAVERASEQYLTTMWEALAMEYSKETEAHMRDTYKALIAAKIAGPASATIALPVDFTTDEFTNALVDQVVKFDDSNYAFAGLHASTNIFKHIMNLTDENGNRLMNVFGTGMNQIGSLNIQALDGSVANVNVKLLPKLADNTLAGYAPQAATFWENPGAPLRLQEQNILNLTQAVGLYGYGAAGTAHPDALVPFKLGAR